MIFVDCAIQNHSITPQWRRGLVFIIITFSRRSPNVFSERLLADYSLLWAQTAKLRWPTDECALGRWIHPVEADRTRGWPQTFATITHNSFVPQVQRVRLIYWSVDSWMLVCRFRVISPLIQASGRMRLNIKWTRTFFRLELSDMWLYKPIQLEVDLGFRPSACLFFALVMCTTVM